MNKLHLSTIIILTIIGLSSCSNVEKLIKSNDFEAKYKAAVKYYEEESYSRATQLFENLSLYYRGKDYAEDIAWYYGQCLIKARDYYSAGMQFRNFARHFPYSDRAEEANYLSAYCKYIDSPDYYLDQTGTKEAIAEFEQFAERYPNSTHIPEINSYLDEMRGNLMRKEYEIAYGYYRIEEYHAAYVALQNFLNQFPDSPNREDATFYMIRSGYEYAINSQESKVKERLQIVVNDFDKLASVFSDSKYMSQAQDIYTRSKAELAKIEEKEENNGKNSK